MKDVTATLNCGEESVSVAIEDIEPGDWAEQVYKADIIPNWENIRCPESFSGRRREISW
jgi:4-oxalocrotonate tautomerase